MPKIKTSRVSYPEGWELIEPTIRELDAKMREAENDPHDGKRKCEALWPIFRISHQRSRYIYDLYYRRKEISQKLYEFCLDQGYADRNLIAKWKKNEPYVGPCNQGPGKQPGHLPLPLFGSKVEEELSSSAHTHTLCCLLSALAES
ncbi:protein BUD31 homolog 1-like isoform X2 [Panicum virgatum]|uniref:protein BUD31 homolog 1-like isoform X2 n=1 Tax=Panicum virgatum TaxID=38727 RepID=UPI0019D66969|nr:protein BUD31 homolog 1-like isoform X2 [Panicum virgatum]